MPKPNPKLMRSTEFCSVGRYTYGRPEFLLFPSSPMPAVTIGAFCSIADDVLFITGGEHDPLRFTTYPLETLFDDAPPVEHSKGPITVGNDVWIGTRATILSGVTIGDGACIGAGAVVASDVLPYTIVAGNPARVIGERRSPGVPWWDWPLDEIEKLMKGLK